MAISIFHCMKSKKRNQLKSRMEVAKLDPIWIRPPQVAIYHLKQLALCSSLRDYFSPFVGL
jgi:hypothetical protein